MTSDSTPKTSAEKVRAYRARKRAQGYRLMQRWVPDVESEEFKERARRAALAVASSPGEKEDQAFIDSVSILNEDP
ncbi:MAG: antitoxin MazE-like protein [bacterium]